MLHGAAWAARPDRAFALVEDPQQLRLADWKDQRTRRRAELAEKTARREAEFTALIPAIAAQVAAEVSAAVAAALQTTRVGHHEGLNHAPKTTSTPTTSVADDHDLNRAPAATSTTTRSVAANYDPTAISTHPAPASVLTACAVRDGNLATHPPTTCSTICPGRAAASAVSTITSAATSASATDVVPKRCCFDCEPAVVTSTPTSTLDISGDCSTVANSLTHDAISTTSPAKASVRASTSTHVPTAVPVDSTLASVPAELDAYAISDEALSVDDTSVSALPAAAMLILATPGRPPDQATLSGMFSGLPIAAGNTVLSLPWDPGAQNSSTTDELSALEHELPIVSRTVHGDTSQLLSSSIHGEYNDCLEVGKLQDLMVALTNLQPWPSWQPYFWGPTEMSSSWAKMIIEIANLGAVMSTKEPLQVLPLSTPCLRDFILLIFAECDALESEARVVLLEEPPQLHGSDIVGDTVVFPQLGDENTLVWYSKDREKQLSLNSVSTVILGQKTINFQRQRWPEKEHQSLSLIYRNGECSLDLICRDRNQAECWHLGLTAFISSPVSPISSVGSKSSRQMTSCTSTLRSYIQRKSKLSAMYDTPRHRQVYPSTESPKMTQKDFFGGSLDCSEALFYQRQRTFSDIDSYLERLMPKVANPVRHGLKDILVDNKHKTQIVAQTPKLKTFEGPRVACRLDSLKDVFLWGDVLGSMLGGEDIPKALPRLVESTKMLDVQSISCGENRAAIITKQGEVFSWGKESSGRLGDKVNANVSCPRIVESFASVHVKAVAFGSSHTCAVTVSGELFEWGEGAHSLALLNNLQGRNQWFPHKLFGPMDNISVSKIAWWSSYECFVSNNTTMRHIYECFAAAMVSYSSSFQHSIAMWSFCNLESCQGQLSWDPGIWALLCSFGLLTQAEVKGKRNDAAPTFCCDHYLDQYFFDKACDDQDAYFDVFRDQVHISHDYLGVFRQQVGAICYFNLVKVCLNYDTHLDLGEVRKPQVPWDPGGSTRHRLEVKPKFKEGGMLATSPTISTGLGLGCYYWLGLLGIGGSSDYIYGRKRLERAARNGRLRPPLLLFLFSFLL